MKTSLRAGFFLLIVGIFAIPVSAHALTITPIRYEIAGSPGETLHQEMSLVNESKNTQTYFASFANFEAQGDTGSPSFIEPRDGLGTWITTDIASVTLAPGQQKKVPFTITIPKDAEPGGYFAAVFWGTSPGDGAGQVSIGTKTGLLILLSVKGDVKESAGLVDFQLHNNQHLYKTLPVGFQYRFSNQGGDRVKPTGSVIVRSIFGWRVKKVQANPFDGNVLPGTTRKFAPEWTKRDSVEVRDQEIARNQPYSFKKAVSSEWHNFAFGIFHARVVAEFGAGHQTVRSKSVWFVVFPFELILVVLVVAIPVYFILRTLIRKYNRAIIRRAQASSQ